jgi:hypothetical protein
MFVTMVMGDYARAPIALDRQVTPGDQRHAALQSAPSLSVDRLPLLTRATWR